MKYRTLVVVSLVSLLVVGFIVYELKKQQTILAKNGFVILLTMSIDPQGTLGAVRSNIDDRIGDYRKSLARWAELPYKVYAVESSGYGNPFDDILKNAPNITYISKKLPHIPSRGKGYGEAHILRYAMDNMILDDDVYIMKITGRYAPATDLSVILNAILLRRPNIIFRRNRSEWFVGKRDFFLEVANTCIQVCGLGYSLMSFEANLSTLSEAKNGLRFKQDIEVISTHNGRNFAVKNM